MRQVYDVLRLKWASGLSERQIAHRLHLRRPTVAAYVQRSTRTLGKRMRQLNQTLGPPQVTEVRVGKLRDGPTRGIEEVVHVCFLAQRVGSEVKKVENPCPSELKSL